MLRAVGPRALVLRSRVASLQTAAETRVAISAHSKHGDIPRIETTNSGFQLRRNSAVAARHDERRRNGGSVWSRSWGKLSVAPI